MIVGESNPVVLADLAKSRMRSKKDQLELALNGNYGVHHGVVARRIINHITSIEASIADDEKARLRNEAVATVAQFIEALAPIGRAGSGEERSHRSRHDNR